VVFFIMSGCRSDVGLQVLPYIDNRHLGSHSSLPAIFLFYLDIMLIFDDIGKIRNLTWL